MRHLKVTAEEDGLAQESRNLTQIAVLHVSSFVTGFFQELNLKFIEFEAGQGNILYALSGTVAHPGRKCSVNCRGLHNELKQHRMKFCG